METPERRLVDSFWDLRDDAYDHPDRWQGVTPVVLFEQLAEYVEAAEERGVAIRWRQDVTERMIAWRALEGRG